MFIVEGCDEKAFAPKSLTALLTGFYTNLYRKGCQDPYGP